MKLLLNKLLVLLLTTAKKQLCVVPDKRQNAIEKKMSSERWIYSIEPFHMPEHALCILTKTASTYSAK